MKEKNEGSTRIKEFLKYYNIWYKSIKGPKRNRRESLDLMETCVKTDKSSVIQLNKLK